MAMQIFSRNFQFTSSNDIVVASKCHPDVITELNSKTNLYYTMDVNKAMEQLATVGKCFQLAYAGCKGFKSCSKIVLILSSYQTMIKNSRLACQIFVDGSLKALKYHVIALKIADKNFGTTMQMMSLSVN